MRDGDEMGIGILEVDPSGDKEESGEEAVSTHRGEGPNQTNVTLHVSLRLHLHRLPGMTRCRDPARSDPAL